MILSFKTAILTAGILAMANACDGPAADGAEDAATETVQAETMPDTGELGTAGAVLRWSRENGALTYRVMYEAPSACYSAGPFGHQVETPENVVLIKAEVAFDDATCAQMITVVKFEGTVEDVSGAFSIRAEITDSKTGRLTTVP